MPDILALLLNCAHGHCNVFQLGDDVYDALVDPLKVSVVCFAPLPSHEDVNFRLFLQLGSQEIGTSATAFRATTSCPNSALCRISPVGARPWRLQGAPGCRQG